MRIAAFTGGRNVASARFRIRQNIQALRALDIAMDEFAGPVSSFPPRTKILRAAWGAAAMASRLPGVMGSWAYQATLLQREMLSTLCTLESWTRKPRIFDVDDAIFLHRGGKPARAIADKCAGVICGNAYIADFFANRPLAIVPTGVDTERFMPAPPVTHDADASGLTIGWSGSASAFGELEAIESALAAVLENVPSATLHIMADQQPHLQTVPPNRMRFTRWNPLVEASVLKSFSVGIMPLADTPWNRGKCAYKMLLYMACGRPVVVSPVGMNRQVLALGPIGHAARTQTDWVDAIIVLLRNSTLAYAMGGAGRDVVQEHFSVPVVAAQLAQAVRRFVGD